MYYVSKIKTYDSERITPSVNVEAVTDDLDKARALAKALADLFNRDSVSYVVLTEA